MGSPKKEVAGVPQNLRRSARRFRQSLSSIFVTRSARAEIELDCLYVVSLLHIIRFPAMKRFFEGGLGCLAFMPIQALINSPSRQDEDQSTQSCLLPRARNAIFSSCFGAHSSIGKEIRGQKRQVPTDCGEAERVGTFVHLLTYADSRPLPSLCCCERRSHSPGRCEVP